MGKKIFVTFIKGFFSAIAVMLAMILCGVGGYYGTRYYYKYKNNRTAKKQSSELLGKANKDDTVARNLVYGYDEANDKITGCVLEVFDTENKKLTYITIPAHIQITIPAPVYKKLMVVNDEIPQVFKIDHLHQYFDKDDDNAFGYGVIILENYFNIDISYFSVLPDSSFKAEFEKTVSTVDDKGQIEGQDKITDSAASSDSSSGDGTDTTETSGDDPYAHDDSHVTTNNYADATTAAGATTQDMARAGLGTTEEATTEDPFKNGAVHDVGVYYMLPEFFARLSANTTRSEMREYLKNLYSDQKSNLSSGSRLSYAEYLVGLNESDISYYCVPGYAEKKTYYANMDTAPDMFHSLNVPTNPDEVQEEETTEEETLEKVRDVVILNASHVQGAAAGWKTKLEADGYNVLSVGNADESLTQTRIVVNRNMDGEDLKKQFPDAEVETGATTSGDAEIYVGTDDAGK